MREYELTVLVHPDLEMNLEAATDKVKALIESNDGKITKENNEGKKKLAYQIKGQDFAVLLLRIGTSCTGTKQNFISTQYY